MSEKLATFNPDWIDPDDAPELTKEWFDTATYHIANKVVTREEFSASILKRGRPVGSIKPDAKQQATLRFDPDLLAALKATGKGWQTRVNDILRQQVLGNQGRSSAAV